MVLLHLLRRLCAPRAGSQTCPNLASGEATDETGLGQRGGHRAACGGRSVHQPLIETGSEQVQVQGRRKYQCPAGEKCQGQSADLPARGNAAKCGQPAGGQELVETPCTQRQAYGLDVSRPRCNARRGAGFYGRGRMVASQLG